LVVRVDEASVHGEGSTFFEDLQLLADAHVHPVIIAPEAQTAREIVRIVNRSTNCAVALHGSDAAMLPQSGSGVGKVQTGILRTLLDGGYIPVIEPTGFSVFSPDDAALIPDDVATAIASALEAIRAIFFHTAGGVIDPLTASIIDELTPAEALALAADPSIPEDLRPAIRAAAIVVRGGVAAAQIVDGRVPHATVLEMLTSQHAGTQVSGSILFAA
jgi:acetylglutamate kinase